MSFEATALVLAWLAILVLTLAMSGLLRQVRILSAAQDGTLASAGPAVGQLVPARLGPSEMLLVFMDHDCPSCARLKPELAAIADAAGVPAAVVFRDDAAEDGIPGAAVFSNEASTFQQLRIPATPFAILASSGEVKRSAAVGSSGRLREFLGVQQEEVET